VSGKRLRQRVAGAGGLCCLLLSGCVATRPPGERGLAAYREGRYAAALEGFDEAVRLDPSSAAAYSNLGATRLRLGDVTGALADFNRAVSLAPNDPELYYNRGNALVVSGDLGLAIADFTRAIQLDPQYARAYYNRGTARLLAGDPGGRADRLAAVEVAVDPWLKADLRRRVGVTAGPASSPAVAGSQALSEPPR
jgi:tetratricopeptide (TPR) repeat protein